MAYGSEYVFSYKGEDVNVDLSILEPKELDLNLYTKGENKFTFKTPRTNVVIEFCLLNGHDEKKVLQDLKGYKKINKNLAPEISLRYKQMIKSINGDSSQTVISKFVDEGFVMQDTKAFKDYIKSITPDIDMTFTFENSKGLEERVNIPIGLNFFWPDITI